MGWKTVWFLDPKERKDVDVCSVCGDSGLDVLIAWGIKNETESSAGPTSYVCRRCAEALTVAVIQREFNPNTDPMVRPVQQPGPDPEPKRAPTSEEWQKLSREERRRVAPVGGW